jgi:hypothetical protein
MSQRRTSSLAPAAATVTTNRKRVAPRHRHADPFLLLDHAVQGTMWFGNVLVIPIEGWGIV